MRELWYVLEDGTLGNPREVAPDSVGILRHKKSGKRIAMEEGDIPSTREVDPPARKDMRAEEAPQPYRTRDMKAK